MAPVFTSRLLRGGGFFLLKTGKDSSLFLFSGAIKQKRNSSMNHVYRIVFNRGLGLWQVVGEHARKQGKRGGRSSPRKHRPAARTPVSAAVMAFASLGTLPTLALAASITGSGDIAPALPAGPVTEWNVYDVLHIGQQDAGTLTVRDGAKLFSYTSRIGTESGSQGSVTIAGAGSTWTHAGHLMIGAAGHGTLNVEDGGQVSNDFASIGDQAGSFGLARITGARPGKRPPCGWASAARAS